MTISATHSRKDYVGNGALDTYPFDFKVLASSDLKVYVGGSLQVMGIHYAVTGTLPGTGNVVFTAGNIPAAAAAIVIEGDTPLTQATDLNAGEQFYEDSLEKMADKATTLLQQIKNRALLIPLGHPVAGPIPFPSLSASKFLRTNPAGTGLEMVAGSLSDIVGVLDDVVPVSADALFPAPGTAGRLRGKSDKSRGLWMDDGARWSPIFGGIINVLDFGVVGDGAADDTAAFQAAIDQAQLTAKAVFIPDIVMKITATITIAGARPIRIFGMCGAAFYDGPSDNSAYLPYGSRIYYTGAGECIKNAASGRTITLEDVAINGPGIDVDGSKGISVTSSMGLSLRNVKIRNFDVGVETGTEGDGNGDTNLFINCGIVRCNVGVDFSQSQNYINTLIQCQIYAGICVRSITPVTIIGGQYSPYYPVTMRKYWETTVTGIAGNVVTLADASNAVPDMAILIQHNAYKVDDYAPSLTVPVAAITVVAGNDVTVGLLASLNTIAPGDIVVYGYLPTAFEINMGLIIGTHVEPPVNEDGSYTGGLLIRSRYAGNMGQKALVFTGNFVNISAMVSPLYPPSNMTKMLPLIYHEHTGSVGAKLVVEGNMIWSGFPTVVTWKHATFRNNNWGPAPHFISADGYPAKVTIEGDTAAWLWGADFGINVAHIDGWPGDEHSKLIGTGGTLPIIRVGEYAGAIPTAAFQEEFITARAGAGSDFIGWKNREATGGAYGYYTSVVLTTEGGIDLNSTSFVATNLNSGGDTGIRPGMEIIIPGAGGGGGNHRTTVMFIDAFASTIHVRNKALTAVAGVTLLSVAPDIKTFGRQAHFGTAAPVTGTWKVGDIVWNTAPAAGAPAYWICTVAGTSGTWKASANLV